MHKINDAKMSNRREQTTQYETNNNKTYIQRIRKKERKRALRQWFLWFMNLFHRKMPYFLGFKRNAFWKILGTFHH